MEAPDRPIDSTIDLLEKARSGDDQALDRLCARYLPRLRRWARSLLPAWAREQLDTDDLVQETLLRTVRQIPSIEAREGVVFQAYVRKALLHRVQDEIRRAKSRRPMVTIDPEWEQAGPSPLEEAVGHERLAQYEAALAKVSKTDQALLISRFEFNMSFPEIAEELGFSTSDAARMAVGRAVLRLSELLGS